MFKRLAVVLFVANLACLSFGQPLAPTDFGSIDVGSESDRVDSVHYEPLCCDESLQEQPLSRFKKQALQSISVSSGGLLNMGNGGLSSMYLDASIGSGIPLGSFDNIIGVRPRVRTDWIDAAPGIDIPDELYQFELQFFYRRPIHDRLSLMAIVSPAIRSDLTTSNDAFRIFALGLLNWECVRDRLTVSVGAVYLGRADLPVLPALGLSWSPNRRTKLDLRFPSSKLAYRLAKDGGRSEVWSYLSGGLGGNTWAVTRQSSATDELSLRDIRLALGAEKLLDGGGGWFAETGFAFARRIEYESDDSEVQLDDAFMVQAGWRY
tara:strand:+ start:307404 stop:308366 length:963 start_codon:yes stop_codon:yes gene_type:complete